MERFAIDEKIKFFRGNEKNCLDRHYQAAKYFDIDTFAKTTSDCCLIDSRVIDEVIELYFSNSSNCDYVSNISPPTFPDGLDIEVLNFSTLTRLSLGIWLSILENLFPLFSSIWLTNSRIILIASRSFLHL